MEHISRIICFQRKPILQLSWFFISGKTHTKLTFRQAIYIKHNRLFNNIIYVYVCVVKIFFVSAYEFVFLTNLHERESKEINNSARPISCESFNRPMSNIAERNPLVFNWCSANNVFMGYKYRLNYLVVMSRILDECCTKIKWRL